MSGRTTLIALLPALAILALLSVPATVRAQDGAAAAQQAAPMTIGAFLDRWAEVEARARAQDQGEAARLAIPLVQLLGQFALDYKAQLAEDRAAGRAPRACPPPGREQKVDIPAFVAALAALPPERRAAPVAPAFFEYLDRRFPCATVRSLSPAPRAPARRAGTGTG